MVHFPGTHSCATRHLSYNKINNLWRVLVVNSTSLRLRHSPFSYFPYLTETLFVQRVVHFAVDHCSLIVLI